MKFKSQYTGHVPMTAGEVIEREALRYDPYGGGQMEHLQHQVQALCQVVCALVELLPEASRDELVKHFAPSYSPVKETP